MLSDIEIAQQAKMQKITDVAAKLGISEDDIELYGKYKAKLSYDLIRRVKDKKDGKLILVTAITPTPAGEGKSTTTVGLAQGLAKLGKKVIVALREPSLGPCMGIKGGAAGGGYSQVVPMEDINLHFTGDFHAITSAHMLLAAMLDNHIQQGNALNIDPRRIAWKRVVDMNDRELRNIVVGLGGKAHGVPRQDGFDITVASEVMAILCLASSLHDLKERLAKIIVAYDYNGNPVTAGQIKAQGAMAALLKDAVKPNLVQTLEGTPAIVHGGPFANIAHGCNSVLATKMALTYGDYVITEAGFGADLGAEKFFDIKCRKAGLTPKLTVIVATAQSLKLHGGVPENKIKEQNIEGMKNGFENLDKHVENMKRFGQEVIVTFNRYASDTDEEIALVAEHCREIGVGFCMNNVFAAGGEGGAELAKLVVDTIEKKPSTPLKYIYEDNEPIRSKIKKVSEQIYGAASVVYTTLADKKIKQIESLGISHYPICIAKTQYSFSSDPKAYGVAKNFELKVRDIIINNGAEMIVVIMGEIMRMPGLPKDPQAKRIDIVDDVIEGLS